MSSETERLAEVSSALAQQQQDLRALRQAVQEKSAAVHRTSVKQARLEAELDSLSAQLRALAEQVARNAAGSADQLGQEQAEDNEAQAARVLAASISVPERFQKALAAVLGEKGSYLVTDDSDAFALRYAAQREKGDVPHTNKRLGVISRCTAASAPRMELSAHEIAAAPEAKLLVDLLQVDAAVESTLAALMHGIVFVPSLAQAMKLNQANRDAGTEQRMIVTEAGEVATPWGWYTTEGEGLGFSWRRRIDELREALETLARSGQAMAQELAAQQEKLTESEAEFARQSAEKDRIIEAQKRLSSLLREEQAAERARREALREEERKCREAALAVERAAQADLQRLSIELSRLHQTIQFNRSRLSQLAGEAGRAACD
ncbi:MAG TPA: hypothetical protein PLP17_16020, partial [Oligoflexia bacterium]|nr:hypothetical protein [Oligoflexia bacterium]